MTTMFVSLKHGAKTMRTIEIAGGEFECRFWNHGLYIYGAEDAFEKAGLEEGSTTKATVLAWDGQNNLIKEEKFRITLTHVEYGEDKVEGVKYRPEVAANHREAVYIQYEVE